MASSTEILPAHLRPARPTSVGVGIAAVLVSAWAICLGYALRTPLDWTSPVTYLLFMVLTHLYTGLFITAHDAMHGLVSPNPRINRAIGTLCAVLFAFNYYPRLLRNHLKHHALPATEQDPDWHPGGFWPWYVSFVRHYVTVWQILAMAVIYNVAKLWIPSENLIVFWMAPAVLSTFQLFYFGTYRPHMGEHNVGDPHRATSQPLGHAWAFATCYFFGYHHEHHAMPWLPWYRLPAARAYSATKSS